MFNLKKFPKTKFLLSFTLFAGLGVSSLCLFDDLFRFQLLAVLKARRLLTAGIIINLNYILVKLKCKT